MAIHESLANKINDVTEGWNQHTGQEVEDFVCRNIITGGEYDEEHEKLLLKREGNTDIDITVSVQKPEYDYGIIVYGIRLDKDNNKIYSTSDLLMQYRQGRVIELGIAIKSAAIRSGITTTISKQFQVKVDMITNNDNKTIRQSISSPAYPISHEYFQIEGTNLVLNFPEGTSIADTITWIDISKMFVKSFKNYTFVASFEQVVNEVNITYSDILGVASGSKPGLNVTNEVINLLYKGATVIDSNTISFEFDSNVIASDYVLSGFVNGQRLDKLAESNVIAKNTLSITNLFEGLNQICLRAIHKNNPDVYTDWLNFDLIVKSENNKNTIVAVNGVNSHITNNGVATLYELTIYSPNNEEIKLDTYLETTAPNDVNPKPTNILKSEIINPASYNTITNITTSTYKKYIEVESDNSSQFLLIKIDDLFYTFYNPIFFNGSEFITTSYFKEMTIDPIEINYTYVKKDTSLNFDQITGQVNNVFVTSAYASDPKDVTVSDSIESSDGWYDNNGRTYFKVSAQNNPVFKDASGLNLNLTDNFTIELGIRTYNVSNIDDEILSIGKLQIKPTTVCWKLNRESYSDEVLYRNEYLNKISKFQEGVETHIVITLQSGWVVSQQNSTYYPDYLPESDKKLFEDNLNLTKGNLVKIYINGVIDREYLLSDDDVVELKKSKLIINPKSSDVDFYLLRVYNNSALNDSEIIKNRISFFAEKTSKEQFFNQNDILDDYTGKISWERCLSKLNTLLYVFPKNSYFPNRFWGGEDGDTKNPNKNAHVSLFVNYADPNKNVKYGGRINKLQVKGQGSSAMRYLIWNVGAQLNKHTDENAKKIDSIFTPHGLLQPSCIPDDYVGKESLSELTNAYHMPPYEEQVDKTEYDYKKMVGKVNYASSMQSHKLGACKLFDDAYKSSPELTASLPSGGRKAVHEEPFMYFYLETELSNEECADLSWEQVLEMKDSIKFMGFQTWGPGKGDDSCSGYNKKTTPEYLMLEGGENNDESVNFLVPWHQLQRGPKDMGSKSLQNTPTITKQTSIERPDYNIYIDDESIVYKVNEVGKSIGAWDIDYGCDENKDENKDENYFFFKSEVIPSLRKFREFYDKVYAFDFTFVLEPADVTYPQESWDKTKKHVVSASTFKLNSNNTNGVLNHQAFDTYRWDVITNSWVRAGLFYNNEFTNDWDRLNFNNSLYIHDNVNYAMNFVGRPAETLLREHVKRNFKEVCEKHLHINDVAFHQAFIKFLSGTDNRAKNTYFQIIGNIYESDGETLTDKGDYLIRLIGDDLDTILATDNNGLQSKDYNLIEDSYDNSYSSTWGDLGNIFFKMFDLCYENEIRIQLNRIMTKSGMSSTDAGNKGNSYFHKNFYKIQEDFPAIAYNHTAEIYYENAYAIYNAVKKAGTKYSFNYTHNGVDPLSQSNGSSLECEKQFMKERVGFLSGYALACIDGSINISGGSGGGGKEMKLMLEFEPFQDFYPTYVAADNDNTYSSMGDLRSYPDQISTYQSIQQQALINRYVAKKGESYVTKITKEGLHQWLTQVNMFKTLTITGLTLTKFSGYFERAVDFTIDNDKISENSNFFGPTWPEMSITDTMTTVGLPVVRNLNLNDITLPDTTDLSAYYKLNTLNLLGASTKYVILPRTGNLKNVTLPSTIKELRIYNNPGLEKLEIVEEVVDNNKNVIIQENLSNLEIVYIDCAKCGAFDVEAFCEKLTTVNALKEITIVNANNLKMTEATISILANKKCRLTGSYWIVDDIKSDSPKTVAISFTTKEQLVNNFGVITNPANDTYVVFDEKPIYEGYATCQEIINLYLSAGEESAQFENAFGLSITDGNNVAIIANEANPHNPSVNGRLNISYSLRSNSGVSKIDQKTGVITVTGTSDKEDIITINIVTTTGSLKPLTCKLICSWVPPKIGDFAYVDGTFSSAYNKSKTLVGLVYDKVYEGSGDSERGTAYIIGKEFACETPLYTGINLTGADANSTSKGAIEINKLKTLLSNFELSTYHTISEIDGIDNAGLSILPSNKTKIESLNKTGKEDTLKYVEHVGKFLNKLKSDDASFNDYYNPSTNRIENNEKLVQFLNKLESDNYLSKHDRTSTKDYELDYTYYNKTVLYPYFYSMYLYEPSVTSDEASAEENTKFKNAYKKNNWYAPSQGELAKVLYCRGISESDAFNNTSINGQELKNTTNELGIFAKAKAKMGDDMPQPWTDLLKRGNNIVTNIYSTGHDNYGYNVYSDTNGNMKGEWTPGSPSSDVIANNYTIYYTYAHQIWRMTTHQGIPFTQYDYAKPNN